MLSLLLSTGSGSLLVLTPDPPSLSLSLCPSLKLTVLLSFSPPLATPTGCTISRMVMRYGSELASACVYVHTLYRVCVCVLLSLSVLYQEGVGGERWLGGGSGHRSITAIKRGEWVKGQLPSIKLG